jgi:hypothetical protein
MDQRPRMADSDLEPAERRRSTTVPAAPARRGGRARFTDRSRHVASVAAAVLLGGLGSVPAAAAASGSAAAAVRPAGTGVARAANVLAGSLRGVDGTALADAYVWVELMPHPSSKPAPMAVLARGRTDRSGRFTLALQPTAAAIAAAKAERGYLNVIVRATTPPGATAAPVAPRSSSAVDITCPPVLETIMQCPPNPQVPAVPTREEAAGTAIQAASHALALWDPFNLYPHQTVASAESRQNVALVAYKAKVFVVPTSPQSEGTSGLKSGALSYAQTPQTTTPGATDFNASSAGCDPTYTTTNQSWPWLPLTDMHAYDDTTVSTTFSQGTATTSGYAWKDDNSGNASWTVDGSDTHTSNASATSGPWGPHFAQRAVAQFHALQQHEHDNCYDQDFGSWTEDYDYSYIDSWMGGLKPDGSDESQYDGQSEYNYYNGKGYATAFKKGNFIKSQGKGYHYSWEFSIFGIGVGGETDWNQQMTQEFDFGSEPYDHDLWGHDGPPTSSQLIFSW